MTVSDKKRYDCTTCPYPRYKDGSVIFCDVCMRRILDEQKAKKKSRDGGVIKITGKEFVIEKGSQKIALLPYGFVW